MDLGTSPRPRFRTDLVAEVMEAEGQRFIDVIDPDTGDAFRFYEVEYSIACAMDGERDVPGLVQWAKEELGIEPSRAELESVITTLGSLGYLESGVRRPIDVELGLAGGRPTARTDELHADDIELGMPGAPPPEPMPSLRRSTRPEDEDEGPTHLPAAAAAADFDDEVSVDLSEHLSIRPSDVKEAVRMSRSMKAVEVPPEVLDEIGQKEAEAAARVEQARAAAQAAHELEAKEPVAPQPPVAPRPPVELPAKPVVVSKPEARDKEKEVRREEPAATHAKPLPPEQPGSGGVTTLLIVLLVLAILGGAAFFVWKYVIDKPETGASEPAEPAEPGTAAGTATVPASGSGAGTATEPAPPPAPPTATLELQSSPPVEVKGGKGGLVLFAAAEGAEIQVGDTVVQYRGAAPILKKIGNDKAGLTWDVETRYPREIEAATKKRDAALAANNKPAAKVQDGKIKERSQRLEEQKKLLEELRAQLAELNIAAPVAGKVVSPVKKGQQVPADGVVAKIEGGQSLVATFEVPATSAQALPAVDASVRIASKDAPDLSATCTVTAVDGRKVAVSCPEDIGIAAGTTVVLAGE